jgi:uncharacterized protein DUF4032/lipopolysaccharide kinase (Kdo/WaaP) family protein
VEPVTDDRQAGPVETVPSVLLRAAGTELLSLPWEEPLAEWSPADVALRDIPVGPSRHLVRFVEADGRLYALKDEPLRVARKEYAVLRTLEEQGLPAVRPVGLVERPSADSAILVTEFLEHSWQYRRLFMRLPPGMGKHRERLFDAMATLLVELHRHGVFWGDCSLANTLFVRDGQRLEAYLVDAETSEIQPTLSAQRRSYDLQILVENVAMGLADVAARLGEPLDALADDLMAEATSVERRYHDLWQELTAEETLPFSRRHEVKRRIKRLNELGFVVEEVRLSPADAGGDHVRLQVAVGGRDYHATQLLTLTGLRVSEGQATILLSDLHAHAYHLRAAGEDVDDVEAADRWLQQVFRPGLALVRRAFPTHDPIQTYCDYLEVRWLLSEQAQRDVGADATIAAMRAREVPSESAATLAVVDPPTTPLERFTESALTYFEGDSADGGVSDEENLHRY